MAFPLEARLMNLKLLGPCSNCGEPAYIFCPECGMAPEYQPGDKSDTYYCDPECQYLDGTYHKPLCDLRRKICAAELVSLFAREVFEWYRTCVYMHPLTSIGACWDQSTGFPDVAVLHLDFTGDLHHPWSREFPSHKGFSFEFNQVAVLAFQSLPAAALLGRMIRHLLEGVVTGDIKFAQVDHKKRDFDLVFDIDDDTEPTRNIPLEPHHTVLIFQLGEERWVMDITGCQFGIEETIVPYHQYFREGRCEIIGELKPYTMTETTDLDKPEDFTYAQRILPETKLSKHQGMHERAARLHLKSFIDAHFFNETGPDFNKDFLPSLMEKGNAVIKPFVADLRSHMREFSDDKRGRIDPSDTRDLADIEDWHEVISED
ncbi:uncharacterized protein F4822DRAFT_433019 [Hypoxylon trugodes]|uniref:uncharacterized protein n=1 Tax=Hypoxylon trugodes TaxID=326681 RepID=UPI0021A18890|nr:uncharacterized protein F4822DRAFT_433019 [Hypoxylon trugodes]KAI1384475.1 hypothetical protein F4822DRAFT_433019 [Hypoxylon trugodes]